MLIPHKQWEKPHASGFCQMWRFPPVDINIQSGCWPVCGMYSERVYSYFIFSKYSQLFRAEMFQSFSIYLVDRLLSTLAVEQQPSWLAFGVQGDC